MPAFASPRNAFFAEIGSGLIGIHTPANRQQLSKWLVYQKKNQISAMSQYLLSAAAPENPALMVMAIDLTDSLDALAIHRGLNVSKLMATQKNVNLGETEKTLAKIKGLTLSVRAGEPLAGELSADFNMDIMAIRFFVRPLLLEALQHTGLYVADFDSWKPRFTDNSVTISGPLSLRSFRKLGMLIKTPAPNPDAASMETYKSLDPAQRTLAASQRYFTKVDQILENLKIDRTKSVKGLAGWYDQSSDQLGKLPILDVDPLLIAFGTQMSEHLRAMGASLRGISLQSSYLQRQKMEGQIYQAPNYGSWSGGYNSYYGFHAGYSGAGVASNVAAWASGTAGGTTTINNYDQVYQMQDQLVTQGAAARIQLWAQIDVDTAAMRKVMTEKYKTEFKEWTPEKLISP